MSWIEEKKVTLKILKNKNLYELWYNDELRIKIILIAIKRYYLSEQKWLICQINTLLWKLKWRRSFFSHFKNDASIAIAKTLGKLGKIHLEKLEIILIGERSLNKMVNIRVHTFSLNFKYGKLKFGAPTMY